MSNVRSVDTKDAFERLITLHEDVVIMFMRPGCLACHTMMPIFEYTSGLSLFKGVAFCKVDCTVASRNNWEEESGILYYIPAFRVYRNGRRFGYLHQACHREVFQDWLQAYLSLSRSSPRLQGGPGVLTGLVLPQEDLNVSTAPGKNTVLEVSRWTDLQFKAFIDQYKYVVVGLYLTNKLHGMDRYFEQTAKLSDFTSIRFLLVNCDYNIVDSKYSARNRPVMWMFRDGKMFSKLTDVTQGTIFRDWLTECLSASRIADSSIPDADGRCVFEYTDPDSAGADAKDVDEDETPEEDAQAPNIEVYTEEAEAADALMKKTRPSSSIGFRLCRENADMRKGLSGRVPDITSFRSQVSTGSTMSIGLFYDDHNHKTQAMTIVLLYMASLPSYSHIKFFRVNCSEYQDIVQEAHIKKVNCPQIVLFRGSSELERRHGVMAVAKFEDWLRPFITTQNVYSGEASGKSGELEALPDESATLRDSRTEEDSTNEGACSDTATLVDGRSTMYTNKFNNLSTSSVLMPGVRCDGRHSEARRRSILNRCLSAAWIQKKTTIFDDLQPGCEFRPVDAADNAIPVGDANRGDSCFSILLIQRPDELTGTITFKVEFFPDPTKHARFTSAILCVEFKFADSDVKGQSQAPKILEVHPMQLGGPVTKVKHNRERHVSGGISGSAPGGLASVSGDGGVSTTISYVCKTASSVTGYGRHSSCAKWTFQEDEGEAGRKGLDPHYELSVVLTTKQPYIVAKIWGKAVMKDDNGEEKLLMGTSMEPYSRNLDLGYWQRSEISK